MLKCDFLRSFENSPEAQIPGEGADLIIFRGLLEVEIEVPLLGKRE